jgi:hypothetical protein
MTDDGSRLQCKHCHATAEPCDNCDDGLVSSPSIDAETGESVYGPGDCTACGGTGVVDVRP